MPAPYSRSPVTVSLVAVPEVSAAVLYGLQEVFDSVGKTWEAITGQQRPARPMIPRIVGNSRGIFRNLLGVPVAPDMAFGEARGSCIVIVPDLAVSESGDLASTWTEATAWLKSEYERGAVLCSVCTGSLMIAAAGLLDGLEATTHWSACSIFEDQFSDVELRPDRVLSPAGPEHRIVTAGGSASWTDLVVYLVARFSGKEEARRISKIFLFGDRGDGQLPFAMLARPKQHDDRLMSECQAWIATNFGTANPVASVTERSGLPARTFARRFRRATGYVPITYVQTLRIEEAKQMLEATDETIETVAEEVGYQDVAAFRRLFKRLTGVSPGRYRERFALRGW
jgi:transcriptional regulator GlxA family with amidase domain